MLLSFHAIVFENTTAHTGILSLTLKSWRRCLGVDDEVVITVRAIFVTARRVQPVTKTEVVFNRGSPVFEFLDVFTEAFFTFLASKDLYSLLKFLACGELASSIPFQTFATIRALLALGGIPRNRTICDLLKKPDRFQQIK